MLAAEKSYMSASVQITAQLRIYIPYYWCQYMHMNVTVTVCNGPV